MLINQLQLIIVSLLLYTSICAYSIIQTIPGCTLCYCASITKDYQYLFTSCGGGKIYKFNGSQYVFIAQIPNRTNINNPQITTINNSTFVAINTNPIGFEIYQLLGTTVTKIAGYGFFQFNLDAYGNFFTQEAPGYYYFKDSNVINTYKYNGSNFTLQGSPFNPVSNPITISYDGKMMYTAQYKICYYNNTGWTLGPTVGAGNQASFSNDGLFLIINDKNIGGVTYLYKFDGINWIFFQSINVVNWCGSSGLNMACHFEFITSTTFIIYFHVGKLVNFTLDGNLFVEQPSIFFMDAACSISHSGNAEIIALIDTAYVLNILAPCPDLCSGGCSSFNFCISGCQNGTILISGVCVCPLATTMSIVTRNCVICNISSCIQCDSSNLC